MSSLSNLQPTWQASHGATLPKSFSSPFTITSPPKTDVWRPSADKDVFNAPWIYQTIPVSQFQRISVTVFGPWKTQYDQGGLLINFPLSCSSSKAAGKGPEHDVKNGGGGGSNGSQWIKAGIEYDNSRPNLGVVGTDRLSDWSISPMSPEYHQKARFVVERKEDTWFVYAGQVGNEGGEAEGELLTLREIHWVLQDDHHHKGGKKGEEKMVEVGVYAAKPTVDVSVFDSPVFPFPHNFSILRL
jgi:regulation of enolase protein 1 (concanavalin A-like superfamily)